MNAKNNSATCLILSSGGKDSILALHKIRNLGFKIDGIITMLPEDPDSLLYHTYNVELVEKIAYSIGIEWYGIEAKKDEEESSLLKALEALNSKVLVSGEVASEFQRDRFERVAHRAKMRHLSPLWGTKPNEILNQILYLKMDVIIVAVAAYGLGEEWLGQRLTKNNIERLLNLAKKYRFSPIGEGGDLESCVLDAPLYRKKIVPLKFEKIWDKDRGYLEIKEVILEDKNN